MTALRNLEVPIYLRKMLGDYFRDRTLWYDTDVGVQHYKTSAGVPQGSVLGPLLWNIMYNGILELNIPEEASIIGFADDIAVTVCARYLDEIEMYANDTIRTIKIWLQRVGLELADHKTEAVLISSRRTRESICIKVGKENIKSTSAIKYLGVMIDDRLKFKQHMEYACKRAAAVHNALSRIMPNVGGPRQSRRMLLARVTISIILYGAPVWAQLIRNSSWKNVLSIFRQCCLRVCCGYRTISLDAVSVVAGMVPLDIMVDEIRRIYVAKVTNSEESVQERKIRERNITIENWQRRWEMSQKGRWTFRLIPYLKKWIKRKHGETNYYLTQFLTGHGGYRSYLFKYGHDVSPDCPVCLEVEDVEHVVFKCSRFEDIRNRLKNVVKSDITPSNIVNLMLKCEDQWQLVTNFITEIHLLLAAEERHRKELRSSNNNMQEA